MARADGAATTGIRKGKERKGPERYDPGGARRASTSTASRHSPGGTGVNDGPPPPGPPSPGVPGCAATSPREARWARGGGQNDARPRARPARDARRWSRRAVPGAMVRRGRSHPGTSIGAGRPTAAPRAQTDTVPSRSTRRHPVTDLEDITHPPVRGPTSGDGRVEPTAQKHVMNAPASRHPKLDDHIQFNRPPAPVKTPGRKKEKNVRFPPFISWKGR